jgi:hypothetical protein
MVNLAQVVDAIVAKLRDIPELVTEMGGNPDRIYAYHDHYPKRTSLPQAIYQMPAPSVMVAWQGTAPGNFGENEAWKHQFSLFLRAGETPTAGEPTAYYRLFALIVNGVPTSTGTRLLYSTIHKDCYPMDTPSISRETDAEGLDYFEVSVTLTEIGDR